MITEQNLKDLGFSVYYEYYDGSCIWSKEGFFQLWETKTPGRYRTHNGIIFEDTKTLKEAFDIFKSKEIHKYETTIKTYQYKLEKLKNLE